MDATKFTTMRFPADEFELDDDELLIGLWLANWAWYAVNRPPISERPIPDPLPCSRCLTPKGGR